MKREYSEIAEHYNNQVGISPYDFFDNSWATTRISGGWPISAERFVAIDYEAWGIEYRGRLAGIHIRVWRNAVLDQVAYIMVDHILKAHYGDFEEEFVWPRGDREFYYCHTYKDGRVKLGKYERWESNTKKRNHWYVVLRRSELDYLYEKLKILENYEPLSEE